MTERVSIEGVRTYLHCPRRYEFAHVHGLESEDDDPPETRRLELLRTAICDALRTGRTDRDDLEEAAIDRLTELWTSHGERFHSLAQRRHERQRLEAAVRAYVADVGAEHVHGVTKLRRETDEELLGPELPLSATIPLPDGTGVEVESVVDYVTTGGGSLTGVRFVPTLAPLGLLRYRSEWEGDVAALFTDHFDPDDDRFEPDAVGALFETAVVLEGLRDLRDRLELEHRTCRYVQVPLVERSSASVNWVRETVETSLETVDLTDVFLDHHTFGMTHEHRNRTVESRLGETLENLLSGAFDPTSAWDRIVDRSCPDCGYAVCCGEYMATEVRFDG